METKTNSRKRKTALIGLGVLTATLLTFFGIQYWKKNKKKTEPDGESPDINAQTIFTTNASPPSTAPKTAPKKSNPKSGQHSGKATTPSTPPPSGSNPTTVKNTASNATQTKRPMSEPPLFEAVQLSKALREAIEKKDFVKTYVLLKKIRNSSDYSYLSGEFKKVSVLGVRRTLVSALLLVFTSEVQRQLLFNAFKKMGLRYENNKWVLSGMPFISQDPSQAPYQLITLSPTQVWQSRTLSVDVPAKMVLGTFVCERKGYTIFENQRQYFLVKSSTVTNYLG
jgi:hypothetical protein